MSHKGSVIVGTIALMAAACLCSAQTLQRTWIVEDFEGYRSTEEMLGRTVPDLMAGKPWWNLWTLRELFGQGSISENVIFEIQLGIGDPNGFTALGEEQPMDDPNNRPQGMLIHYAIPSGSESCDAFIFSSSMGVPVEILQLPEPLPVLGDKVPTVDVTQFDKLSVKIRKRPGNRSSLQGRFEVGFIGWDLKEIGRFMTVRPTTDPAFMAASGDVWEVFEIDLSSELILPGAADRSAFPLTHIGGMYIGMEDRAAELDGTDVWYVLDEIAFYNESAPCAQLPAGDLTGDCKADLEDLAAIAAAWLGDLALP